MTWLRLGICSKKVERGWKISDVVARNDALVLGTVENKVSTILWYAVKGEQEPIA